MHAIAYTYMINVLDQFWENLFEHHSQNFDNGFETFLRLLWVETIMKKCFCQKTFHEMKKILEESIMKGNTWFIIILSVFLKIFWSAFIPSQVLLNYFLEIQTIKVSKTHKPDNFPVFICKVNCDVIIWKVGAELLN